MYVSVYCAAKIRGTLFKHVAQVLEDKVGVVKIIKFNGFCKEIKIYM